MITSVYMNIFSNFLGMHIAPGYKIAYVVVALAYLQAVLWSDERRSERWANIGTWHEHDVNKHDVNYSAVEMIA